MLRAIFNEFYLFNTIHNVSFRSMKIGLPLSLRYSDSPTFITFVLTMSVTVGIVPFVSTDTGAASASSPAHLLTNLYTPMNSRITPIMGTKIIAKTVLGSVADAA